MKRKVSDIQRHGSKVAEIPSSKGDKKYDIYQEEDGRLTCNCTGFSVRKQCRHLDEARFFLETPKPYREEDR